MKKTAKKLTSLEQAIKYLAIRAHSSYELIGKLKRRGYSVPEINEAIKCCLAHRYLDDEQYAKDFAALLSTRGCGSRLIAQKLKQKGIGSDLRQCATNDIDTERTNARSALEFKLRMLSKEPDLRKKREKAFRFLISRGFEISLIKELFDELGV